MIGMHRSGTRLVADLLHRLGVFMGADRQADGESVSFMLLNEAILQQCGAFWSEPMSAHVILSDASAVRQLAAGIGPALDARITQYLGDAPGDAALYGWKDPRNTFTLAVWRELYPDLRAIHVTRHGVDVAASLSRRHSRALAVATGKAVPDALTVIRDDVLGVLSSRRGWTLSESLTMWEQYLEKARQHVSDLGDNAYELRFEDLLEQPARAIREIARFCGVAPVDDEDVLADGIDRDRAFAFRRDPELRRFAEMQQDVLARFGYSP